QERPGRDVFRHVGYCRSQQGLERGVLLESGKGHDPGSPCRRSRRKGTGALSRGGQCRGLHRATGYRGAGFGSGVQSAGASEQCRSEALHGSADAGSTCKDRGGGQTVIDADSAALLQDIVRRERRSVLLYVSEAFPWTTAKDSAALAQLSGLIHAEE